MILKVKGLELRKVPESDSGLILKHIPQAPPGPPARSGTEVNILLVVYIASADPTYRVD